MKQTPVTIGDVELAIRRLSAEMREMADEVTRQASELREQIAKQNGNQPDVQPATGRNS